MNKTKSWFFEKVNKIDKPLARLIKKQWERTQINKIRNEKEVTTDTTEMQSILRDYYKQLYANKVDNKEEIENMNRPITSTEIETVILKLPNKQKSRTRWPHRQILSTFR